MCVHACGVSLDAASLHVQLDGRDPWTVELSDSMTLYVHVYRVA